MSPPAKSRKSAKKSGKAKPAKAASKAKGAKRSGKRPVGRASKAAKKSKAKPKGAKPSGMPDGHRHCSATDPFGGVCQNIPREGSTHCNVHSYLDRK